MKLPPNTFHWLAALLLNKTKLRKGLHGRIKPSLTSLRLLLVS